MFPLHFHDLSLYNFCSQQPSMQFSSPSYPHFLKDSAYPSPICSLLAFQTMRQWSWRWDPLIQIWQWLWAAMTYQIWQWTLMLSSSLSKVFPRLIRWFIMWVNHFCTSTMVSPFNILNISYSCMRVWFLDLFTSFAHSWVTSKESHISFVDSHWDTLKNSLELKADVVMFLAMQSYWDFLLSCSVHWDQGFQEITFLFSTMGIKGSFLIAFQIPLWIASTKIFIRTIQNW